MGLWGLLATAFVVGLSGAMAPGSLLVVVVTETVRKGFWAGPAALAGHFSVELLMTVLLALGVGRVLSYPAVLGVIGLAGGLMMLWFGWGTWKTARSATLSLDKPEGMPPDGDGSMDMRGQRSGLRYTVLAGMAASVANAYWVLWWATVGAAYVAAGMTYGVLGPTTFYIGHILSDAVWYVAVSLAVSTGAKFLNDRVYRGVLYVCGIFLFVFGAYFLKIGFGFVAGR